MADELGLPNDTHSHGLPPRDPIVWVLVAAVAVLAVAVAVLAWHILGRQQNRDVKDEQQRVAICAILRQIPNEGHPVIAQAKDAFHCAGV